MSKLPPRQPIELTVNDCPIVFRPDEGTFTFAGRTAALFWLDPSLLHLLAPLVRELGPELARALIALHASRGAEPDYAFIISNGTGNFEAGFEHWSAATATAGWGRLELAEYDPGSKRATVRATRPWELVMQQDIAQSSRESAPSRWGCPFLLGKLIGLFSRAFGENCWAKEGAESLGEDGEPRVEIHVYPSDSTVDGALDELRRAQRSEREAELEAEVNRSAAELRRSEMYLRTILRNSPSILFTLDAEGRFLISEGRQLALLGLVPGQVVGLSAFDLYKEPDIVENLRGALAGEERTYMNTVSEHDFEVSVAPLHGEDGRILGALGIALDVTDRRRAQQYERQQREALEREVQEKQEVIRALGTPVIRLWEGVLLLPLVGALDRARVGQLIEAMLRAITEHRTSEVLLDVTGVPSVDADVADALIASVQAAQLLGTVCSLVGISPDVARALVQLGADLGRIPTYATLEGGLKHALARLNYQVTRAPLAK
jgi:rsbT co-antagonist protein RsbR